MKVVAPLFARPVPVPLINVVALVMLPAAVKSVRSTDIVAPGFASVTLAMAPCLFVNEAELVYARPFTSVTNTVVAPRIEVPASTLKEPLKTPVESMVPDPSTVVDPVKLMLHVVQLGLRPTPVTVMTSPRGFEELLRVMELVIA